MPEVGQFSTPIDIYTLDWRNKRFITLSQAIIGMGQGKEDDEERIAV